MDILPGRPLPWRQGLIEIDRVESDDPQDVVALLAAYGLAGEPAAQSGDVGVAVLLGARGCAVLSGLPQCRPSPADAPECVAVAYRRAERPVAAAVGSAQVGTWRQSWSVEQHGHAIEQVRAAIGRGEVYQANVVGHRSAPLTGDRRAVVRALAQLPGAAYGGALSGQGWTVVSASPEQLVRVTGTQISTQPVKGTAVDAEVLRSSVKDRAEHVMIVDLARNDLARVTRAGTVDVPSLYSVSAWAGLQHAASTVVGELCPGMTVLDVLRALAPGGSVTGAPKWSACQLLADLEPVGRGPSMGALGFVWPGGLDLGLTIRTIVATDDQVHLWAGGGVTWGSDAPSEVAEAEAKAAPVIRVLAGMR